MLEASYNAGLVLASVAISMMAAFTGLWLTRGLSTLATGQRQLRIAMASVALGDGIWSMHFTAILAISLPVPVSYAIMPTLASLLIAILLSGLALLVMHFSRRSLPHIVVSGMILGLGIVAMHYTGMAAMELCQPTYSWPSILGAAVIAPLLGIAAIWVAYGRRSRRNMVLATLVLGSTVVVVHFTAMAGTGFYEVTGAGVLAPMLDNQELALVVLLSAFLICGAFLLTGATFFDAPPEAAATAAGAPKGDGAGRTASATGAREAAPEHLADHAVAGPNGHIRIPIERRGHTEFVDGAEIAALRAEGHYTIAYCCEDKFFCPWSISEAERRLTQHSFLRAHRSYLVNLARISAFERHRDGGFCLFFDVRLLDRVPVSRSRVAAIREALAL